MNVDERIEQAFKGVHSKTMTAFVRCPFCDERGHGPDPHRALRIGILDGRYWCSRCRLMGRLQKPLEFETQTQTPDERQRLLEGLLEPQEFVPLFDRRGQRYGTCHDLLSREYPGITRARFEALKIGTCSRGGFYNQVIIPNIGLDGLWSGFSSTRVDKPEISIQTPEALDRKSALWIEPSGNEQGKKKTLVMFPTAFDALPWRHDLALGWFYGQLVQGHESELAALGAWLVSEGRDLCLVWSQGHWRQPMAAIMALNVLEPGLKVGLVIVRSKSKIWMLPDMDLWESVHTAMSRDLPIEV